MFHRTSQRSAVSATERVYGVKAVADELEVRLRNAHTRDDSDIAESVAHTLKWNTVLASQHIQAEVTDGHVATARRGGLGI